MSIAQSDDSVKKAKALFLKNNIVPFDSFGKKKKELIDSYEDAIFETMSNEADDISRREKTLARKSKSDKRTKSPDKNERAN